MKQTNATPKLFIGLDIYKSSWKFHFASDLVEGKSHSFLADIPTIINYVNKHFKDYLVSIAYEVGCCGYVPARSFIEAGWNTFVVNPADIPKTCKNKFVKTDRIDAKNIAKLLRAGQLKKVTIPELQREALRALSRQRTALVRDFRRIKSRMKSLLLYLHTTIPQDMETPKWPLAFIQWLKDLKFTQSNNRPTLNNMIEQYRFIDLQNKNVSNLIRANCRNHQKKDYNLLRSVPGIGPLTAAYTIAELGNLRKYPSVKK